MKRIECIAMYLLLIFSVVSAAQNKKADSLVAVLGKTRNDIDRAQLFNTIADEYKASDPKLMLQYANQALALATKIKFNTAKGNAFLNLGNANILTGDYPQALRYFSNAQSVFEEALENASNDNNKEIKNGLARAYGSLGVVFSEQSNYAKALQFHLKAVKLYEESNNLEKCARVYNNIGVVYKSQGEDFKALNYFIKCLKTQEKIGDNTIGITMTNIGTIYLNQKSYLKAFEYFCKAEMLFEKYPNQRGLGELYNNLGLYYVAIQKPAEALVAYNKAIATFNSIDDKFGLSDTYYFIGEVYYAQKNWDEALTYTNKSLALAKELDVLDQVQIAEKRLSEIYEKLNKPNEALAHFKLYNIAKDSISNNENIRNSVRAEMNFEFDKKEALQRKEQEKREVVYNEESKRHQQQIVFVILFILLAFGIAFLLYNRLQLKKTLTLQKDLAEYEQKALHLQMNPHFVFNCLGSISSFIVQNGTDSAIKYLSKFSKLMRLTLEYSKESLIPIDKEVESLQNYLELEQLRFNNKFTFTIYKSNEIEDDMAIPPLLLQPFVENAIIHGVIPKKEMGSIAIRFEIEKESLLCTVEDNGIGFQQSKAQKVNSVVAHKSMALDITKKRLEMIESVTNQKANVIIEEVTTNKAEVLGTKVTLHLPIQYAE
ncbi:tetratricopeptide repeat-containing sensor histidine kinase [Flavobacterium sp. XGLA_31]|uniref:tetratricopeptide repeat-containing sensor histidine kinase n=1 Tax=Flavobacterium sp. XGLA_31 TaxID=3447666 RepID=UPI003F3717D3